MDAFVYNRSTGVVTLVSVGLDGMAAGIATDNASPPVISPDGHYVAFESTSGDLVPGFTNSSGTIELYLRDLQTGTTAADFRRAGRHSRKLQLERADIQRGQ